jgi:hypothetical protein
MLLEKDVQRRRNIATRSATLRRFDFRAKKGAQSPLLAVKRRGGIFRTRIMAEPLCF